MRQITIQISPRIGTNDNSYYFSSVPNPNPGPLDSVYAFISMQLQYSVITSNVLSQLTFSMNEPQSSANVLRSGQYIEITDTGQVVFQGVLLTVDYILLSPQESGMSGLYTIITLAPSIYQFTIMPTIFDQDQVKQIQQLTKINIQAILAASVTQSVKTTDLLDYIISNSDYSNFFNGEIDPQDLGDSLYVMTTVGESRDQVLRTSIDYYNCVFYQQEDGDIIIRQLDAQNYATFSIDLENKFDPNIINTRNINGTFVPNEGIPYIPLLQYTYSDNAYSTPAVISNYAMLSPEIAVLGAGNCVLSYAPNPKFFPRIADLEAGGWFVGAIGVTQLNNNVTQDPTTFLALQKFFKSPDVYMSASQATGIKDQRLASYQALLTAKQTAMEISQYATLQGTVSLDDPNLPNDIGNFVGSIMQIQNCDMKSGLVASATRSYSTIGSYLSFNITPMGSFTGFWKNSQ